MTWKTRRGGGYVEPWRADVFVVSGADVRRDPPGGIRNVAAAQWSTTKVSSNERFQVITELAVEDLIDDETHLGITPDKGLVFHSTQLDEALVHYVEKRNGGSTMSLFSGKAGFVTGAASGIGRATAIAFAREGASVIVADIEGSRARSEETVETIRKAGGKAEFVPVDVTRADQVQALVKKVVDTYGTLDFAFNNAGVLVTGFAADLEEADFDRVMAVDVKGVWLCMKYGILYMRANGGGVIVNAASEAGLVGTPKASAYVAAKHAVVGLTKAAAGEYANMGIRINAVAPGAIATPMVLTLPKDAQDVFMDPQPMHRFGTSEEIAEAVIFLASDKASFITGTILSVDGGATSNAQSYNPALSPSN